MKESGKFESDSNNRNSSVATIEKSKEELEQEKKPEDISTLLGKEFSGFKKQDAINKLMQEKEGHIKNAFFREDIGNIDLIWGNDKIGLQHIITQRIKQEIEINEFLNNLTDVIENGILQKSPRGNYEILKNNKIAVVQPEFKGNKFNFIITAFKTRKTS